MSAQLDFYALRYSLNLVLMLYLCKGEFGSKTNPTLTSNLFKKRRGHYGCHKLQPILLIPRNRIRFIGRPCYQPLYWWETYCRSSRCILHLVYCITKLPVWCANSGIDNSLLYCALHLLRSIGEGSEIIMLVLSSFDIREGCSHKRLLCRYFDACSKMILKEQHHDLSWWGSQLRFQWVET